jgi:hypothetical protein
MKEPTMNSTSPTRRTEALPATAPQSERGAAFDRASALQNALIEATHISVLLQWIADARALLETVREVSGYDKQLDARLEENKIQIYAASWSEVHSEALSSLIGMQHEMLSDAQGKVH